MSANFNLTSASALFKIKYEKLSENVYNSSTPLLARVKKSYDFTGKQLLIAVPRSFAGGVGSGSLPAANTALYSDAVMTAKKVYSVVELDRETMKAAMTDEASFVRATKEVIKKGVESWMRNMSRILFNDATAALGISAGNASGSAGAPVITITAASFKEANWEEKDLINAGTDAAVFEITDVNPDTRVVTLSRISGSLDLTGAGALTFYMQNSKDSDPQGLKSVIQANSGSLYGITVARRWQSFQKDANAQTISADLMNSVMLNVERKCGKAPNLIVTSYKQYEKLLNVIEDQKRYPLEPRAQDLKGKISFTGLEFMSSRGPIGIFPDRFCENDTMYFLNDDKIEIFHRPDFGWFNDDGTVFLRKASSDSYEARYGGYLEVYMDPNFHGVLTNLNIA